MKIHKSPVPKGTIISPGDILITKDKQVYLLVSKNKMSFFGSVDKYMRNVGCKECALMDKDIEGVCGLPYTMLLHMNTGNDIMTLKSCFCLIDDEVLRKNYVAFKKLEGGKLK